MTEHDQPAVIVEHVYKSFRLPHEQHSGLKQFILNFFRHPSKRVRGYETQHVLEDISFEIKKGEFFGIVGRNGSGKSTLLKLLAGIYTADKGKIGINGSLTPFIELGVGFNPELTGRENVYLNGALLGFSHDEMDAMYTDIVSFAELEKFMDQKLKNYSSGMQVRLAFSIAIRAESSILLLDEVLAVGDEAFQKKCVDIFEKYKKNKKTIILVTHDMSVVERFCSRALIIDEGAIIKIGKPHEVAKLYQSANKDHAHLLNELIQTQRQKVLSYGIQYTIISKQNRLDSLVIGDTITIYTKWRDPVIKNVGIAITKMTGELVHGANTINKILIPTQELSYNLTLDIGSGNYEIVLGYFGSSSVDEIVYISDAARITVHNADTSWDGIANLKHSWRLKDNEQ